MKAYDVQHLRNVGLIGQGGAGKTSLAEAMLFDAGTTQRLGKVANGSSIFDCDPDEVTRQKSINAMLGFASGRTRKLTSWILLATPTSLLTLRAACGSWTGPSSCWTSHPA